MGEDVFPVEFEAHAWGLGDGDAALVVEGRLGGGPARPSRLILEAAAIFRASIGIEKAANAGETSLTFRVALLTIIAALESGTELPRRNTDGGRKTGQRD